MKRNIPKLGNLAALPLILDPSLLPALTLEHADGAAIPGIKHGQNRSGLAAAMTARLDRIGVVAGKDLVLKFVITHE